MDYDDSAHFSAWGIAAAGVLVWQQLWLPLACVVVVLAAALIIRLTFRPGKRATDV
ncbi:MAG: hypothetical protein ABSG64_06445 [Solirubrobacteraceae bacterium]|jgi:lipopolysaccharide export LptBFGC system permease protein LptF